MPLKNFLRIVANSNEPGPNLNVFVSVRRHLFVFSNLSTERGSWLVGRDQSSVPKFDRQCFVAEDLSGKQRIQKLFAAQNRHLAKN